MQGTGFNFGAASTPSTPAFGASNPIFGSATGGELGTLPIVMLGILHHSAFPRLRSASCECQQVKARRPAHRTSLEASAHQLLEQAQLRLLHSELQLAQHLDLVRAHRPLEQLARLHLVLQAQAFPACLAARLPLEPPARQRSALQVCLLALLLCSLMPDIACVLHMVITYLCTAAVRCANNKGARRQVPACLPRSHCCCISRKGGVTSLCLLTIP
jgi:hypothetical protein